MPEILFFPYLGPGRRSDLRVVEIRLDFAPDEPEISPQTVAGVRQLLLDAGIETDAENYPDIVADENQYARYARLLAQTALLLQRKNGHRVNFFSVTGEPGSDRYTALVEHEHSEVGMTAVKLAIELVSGKFGTFAEDYRLFSRFSLERLLPIETEAIIRLARQRSIPVFQLEREPLANHFNTGFRVRPNGLLILGHGKNCHVLDGTFCVDRAGDDLKALLRNPDQRLARLKVLGMTTVPKGRDAKIAGRVFHLILVNRRVFAVEQSIGGAMRRVDTIHESVIEMCRTLYRETNCAAMAISLKAASLSMPLAQSGGSVLDFNPAPDLEQLLSRCEDGSSQMDAAAGELLDWLFPGPEAIHIPVIAVTGTNGKTTTSRMVSHILQASGRKPGLVCTDGIYLNGQQLTETDAGTIIGHARVLTSTLVDAAVLEAHHRGIAIRGFAFDDCDVAVCLNVTEEHLEKGEIETLEEMAVIKRALLERARHAAVLSADDPCCLAMIGHLNAAKICLVSLQSGRALLEDQLSPERACFCVLETIDNETWIILYHDLLRIPVMPVNQIPATFDGAALFNVSNAMHAIAACYFAGTNIGAIRSALSGFYAGEKLTPGRMNEIEGLPFRVFIDFAHNPDGMKNVCDFVDRTDVAGRKIIAFAVASNRTEDANAKVARAAAGHFDFYFCKEYQPLKGDLKKNLAPLIQQVLIDAGVPAEKTAVVSFGREVINSILDGCEPGDLLMLLLGHVEKHWVPAYIREYASHRYGLS